MIEVCDLKALDRAALIAVWSEVFQAPAPRGISQTFLRRFLAFELQARRLGGLPKTALRALAREDAAAPRNKAPALRPGGRLLREWNGITHTVDVTKGGFAWNGTPYRSLSAIARAITGAHWSGPRFFGLNGKGSR